MSGIGDNKCFARGSCGLAAGRLLGDRFRNRLLFEGGNFGNALLVPSPCLDRRQIEV